MSALRAARVGDHAQHGFLPEGRDGAGDESTGSDVAGDGEEDHLVASGGDIWASATDTCGAGGSATWKSGFHGLFDRRRGSRRGGGLPVATVEQVFALYREKYFDLNVQHFHEKLEAEHGIELSYSWVKQALQGAGLVARGRKRGAHRKRRDGGRCRGCCCTSTAAGTSGFRTSAGTT